MSQILTRNELGYNLGIFFTNSSGHPVHGWQKVATHIYALPPSSNYIGTYKRPYKNMGPLIKTKYWQKTVNKVYVFTPNMIFVARRVVRHHATQLRLILTLVAWCRTTQRDTNFQFTDSKVYVLTKKAFSKHCWPGWRISRARQMSQRSPELKTWTKMNVSKQCICRNRSMGS
jgi:hypothetical protein